MIAQILTPHEIYNCEGRNYNPIVWEKKILDLLKMCLNVEFYKVAKGDGYDYDRYFVEYTLPEGLRLFKEFSYADVMTNGGFYRLDKLPITDDGKTYADLVELIQQDKKDEATELGRRLAETNLVQISYGKMQTSLDEGAQMVMIGTSREARLWMIDRCKKFHMTFTKG